MYEIEGMGIRIQARRKELGLTQGEFADQLNISPQAVSKWETGLGFPDLSSLPDIARVLEMSIDELFGRNLPKAETQTQNFPPQLENEIFIKAYGDCALYADPALLVDTMAETWVRFEDDSTADLSARRIINRGVHSIRLVDTQMLEAKVKMTATQSEALPEDQIIRNLRFDLHNYCDIEILPSEKKTYWETETRENIEFIVEGDELIVRSQPERSRSFLENSMRYPQEDIRLYVPPQLHKLSYTSKGFSDLLAKVNFQEAHITILGSSDLDFGGLEHVNLDIKGSADVHIKKAGSMNVEIAGSGDVVVDEILGDFKARLRGAGDIQLLSGDVGSFDLSISGAGDVNAAGVTAGELDARLHGPGSLVLGRLLGSSRESTSFMGTLKILQRG